MPKKVPEAMPIRAVLSVRLRRRLVKLTRVLATAIAMTPAKLIKIASAAPKRSRSPNSRMPMSAVWTVSVLE
jgi:hypothetical protein